MKFSMAPPLEGLAALARTEGLDMRPILVRVLTDLYVRVPTHAIDEQNHYVELMLRFLEAADIDTRANVARKLAIYAAAPPAIIARLARDVIEVAEPVLRYSSALSPPDLREIARLGGRHAAVIGARLLGRADATETPAALSAPLDHDDIGSDRSNVMNVIDSNNLERDCREKPVSTFSHPALGPARETGPAAPTVDVDAAFAEAFLAADGARRRMMLLLPQDAAVQLERPLARTEESLRRLETAALRRQSEPFARELQTCLAIAPALAERIARDESGEALVVVLRPLEVSANGMLRILLFLTPQIGNSVDRVFDLTRLYETLNAYAALRIVGGLQRLAATADPRHAPSLAPDSARRPARPSAEPAKPAHPLWPQKGQTTM